MSLRTRRDNGTRGAKGNARADIRDDFELPQHTKPNPAFLPSPPLSRTTTASQGGSMNSPLKADGDASDPHTCPHCARQFRRLCDLNKHAKSHIRPFKCSDSTCKYSTLGWPTRKELERHNNDKHAPAPQTYRCLFQPCTYESKRESNCKQHMEKTHGYVYVRCKYNGARLPGHVKTESYPEAEDVARVVPIVASLNQPKSPKLRGIGGDFLLYPDDADHSIIIGHDNNNNSDDPDRRDSQVFIPWTSPSTRFRANMTLLRRFSQAYEPSERSVEHETEAEFRLSQIDPNLESVSTNMADKPVSSSVGYAEALALDDGETMEMQSPKTSNIRERAGGAVPTSQSQVTASSSTNPIGLSNVASQKTAMYPMSFKQDDSDDNDEERPRKRLRRSDKMDFRDTEMPDIFHAAHPQIYNRDKKALFGSCHSTHKDISTLVRHLGRAPHKLDVRERYVSSFDVQDEEHWHPKVGLCRRCWVRFHDRESFNRHIATECEKASKGKREKWQILYDTFTPISEPTTRLRLSDGYSNPLSGNPLNHNLGSHIVRHQRHETQPAETPGPESLPISPPPPTSVDMGWSVASQHMDDGAFVPMAEYRRLDATVQTMQADLQSLKRLMQAFIIHNTGRPSALVSSHHVVPNVNPFDSHPGDWTNRGPQEGSMGPRDEAAADDDDVGSLPDRLDRGSLVGYMDSQPTDVDPQGLIEEVEETLSRANSGLGSERSALRHSALRHVPNSPPTRAHEDADAVSARSGGPSAHGRAQSPRHQTTSIPDSGYGSDKKRGSLGELDLNEQLKKPATHPEGPQQPQLLHPHDAVMSGDHKQPLQQDHLSVAHHRGAVTNQDPAMVSPYLSETGVSMPGWEPQGAFAPSDPPYVNEFVQGSFSPYGSGGDGDFPFNDYVYHSED